MKYLSLLPAVVIMIVIFLFSSKPAVESDESSMVIVNGIIQIYENISNTHYQGDTKEKIVQTLDHIVRKSAHFCEYAILAMAVAFHLLIRKQKGKLLFFVPILTVFLYAVTDEFHQLFVPGRAGLFKDVLIDTSGGTVGSLIFILFVISVINRKKVNKITARD